MSKFGRRLRQWIRGRRADADLAAELATHRAMAQDALEARGLPSEEAARESRRRLGNITLAREDARAVWTVRWIESSLQDVKYALRGVRRQPGFALAVVLALGLAIGLVSSVFTVFNAVFLRPWPGRDPARVVNVVNARFGWPDFSVAEYRYLAERAQTFRGLVAVRCLEGWTRGCGLDVTGRSVEAAFVSLNFFDALAVPMTRGRGFVASDDDDVVVVSDRAWRTLLGGDPNVVGHVLELDALPFTVVGVTSPEFTGTRIESQDLWIPLNGLARLRPHDPRMLNALTRPLDCCVTVAGRIADGVTRREAQAEIDALSRQFRSEWAPEKAQNGPVAFEATSLFPFPGQERRVYTIFALLFAGALLVLLLSCANAANLLLARAAARRAEMSVRRSLGAGWRRLLRQLITESAVLSLAAGALGLLIAAVVPVAITSRVAIGRVEALRPDVRVLIFTFGVTAVTCFAFGLMPSWHAARRRSTTRGTERSSRFSAESARGGLLALQVAVSVLLLGASGLMVRGLQRAVTADAGFAVGDVAAVTFTFPGSTSPDERASFAADIVRRAAAVADPAEFGFASDVPIEGDSLYCNIHLPGVEPGGGKPCLEVSASYFDLLHIPLLSGRSLEAGDSTMGGVVVNEAFARTYFPGQTTVGQVVMTGDRRRLIVGVVGNADTTAEFLSHTPQPMLYAPIWAIDRAETRVPTMLVRGEESPSARAITVLARELNGQVRVRVVPLSTAAAQRIEAAWLAPALASGLGALSLLLASFGVFSVFAYLVQQRRKEIGIRLALGASPGHVLVLLARSNIVAIGAGVAIGIAASIVASRLIRSFLYGLDPLDPGVYATLAGVLLAAGILAMLLPAWRALRVDPMVTLRLDG